MSKRTNQTFTPDRKIKACTRPSFVYQKPKGCKSVVNSVIERHVINYEDIDYAFYFVMCKVIYPNDPEGTSKVFLNPSNPNNHVLYAAQDLDPEIISDYLDAMPSKYQSRSSRIRVNRLLSQGPRTESEYCEARMSVELQRILLRQAKIIHGSISSSEKKKSLTVKESRLEDSSSEDSDESPQDVDESPKHVDESPEDSDESPEERLEKKKKGPTSAMQIANKTGEYSDSEDDDDFVVKNSQNSSQEENESNSDDFSCSEEEDEENLELKTQEKQPEREVEEPNKPVTGLSLECETPQEKVKLVDKHDKSEGCFNINAFSSAYGIVDDCPFEQQEDVYEEQKSTEETFDDSNNKDEANPMEEENSFDIFSGIIEFVVDVGNTTPSTLGEKDEENVSLTIDGEHQPLLGNEDPTTQPPNDDEKQTLSEMDDSACQPTQFVEQPPVVEDEVLITQPPAEDEKQTCAEKDDSIAQPAKNDERNLIAVPNESIVQSSNDDKKDGNVETNQNNDNESFDGLFDGDSDSDTDTAKEQHQDTEMGKRKKSITVYESDDAMTEASEVPYPVEKDETASKEGKHSIQNPAQESVQEHIQEPVKGASNGRPKRQRASVAPKASKNSKGGVKKQRGRFSRPVESDEDSNVDDENDLSFYPSS